MKIEIGRERPGHYPVYWEGLYSVFHHFEFLCGIPSVMFAVTTLKENGQPNVCLQAWSSFTGEGGGYYTIMGGVGKHSHTYQNIQRTKTFVINFLGPEFYDGCISTIAQNKDEIDEMAAGGFTAEKAATVDIPRITEAFLCMECELEKEVALDDCQNTVVLIGKVRHIALQEEYAKGMDQKYGERGFMLNLNEPKNAQTGEGKASAVAVAKVVRVNEEG